MFAVHTDFLTAYSTYNVLAAKLIETGARKPYQKQIGIKVWAYLELAHTEVGGKFSGGREQWV